MKPRWQMIRSPLDSWSGAPLGDQPAQTNKIKRERAKALKTEQIDMTAAYTINGKFPKRIRVRLNRLCYHQSG